MRHYVWWIRGAAHAELAAMSIQSVQRVDPFAAERRLTIVTDDVDQGASWEHVLPNAGRGIQHRILPPGRPAMVANLDAQLAALALGAPGDKYLFLDADTLLRVPFWPSTWTLDDVYDLYVTFREEVNGDTELAKQQPYNYGVLGATHNEATLEAFHWLRARILRMCQRYQDWFGNQLALAELIGLPAETKIVPLSWCLADRGHVLRTICLPCERWNYSPNAEGEDIDERNVIHLKGGRKDLMAHYAKRLAA